MCPARSAGFKSGNARRFGDSANRLAMGIHPVPRGGGRRGYPRSLAPRTIREADPARRPRGGFTNVGQLVPARADAAGGSGDVASAPVLGARPPAGHFGSPISGRMGERRRRADSAVRASQTGRSRAPLLDSGRTRRRRHRVVSPQRESEKRHGRRAARRRPVGVGHASQSVNGRHPCLKARVDLRRRLSRTLRSARRAPLTLIRTSRILVPQKRRKPRGANAERLSRGAHPRIAGAVPSSGSS